MLEELVFSTSVTLLVKLQELERKEVSLTKNNILRNQKIKAHKREPFLFIRFLIKIKLKVKFV